MSTVRGTRRVAGFAVGLAVIAAAAGCGSPAAAPARSGMIAATAVSSALEAPERTQGSTQGPSDLITGYWVLGTVTIGGVGPCYALRTDVGRTLVLIGRTIGSLAAGDRVRVLVRSDDPPPACHGVEAMTALQVKRAG